MSLYSSRTILIETLISNSVRSSDPLNSNNPYAFNLPQVVMEGQCNFYMVEKNLYFLPIPITKMIITPFKAFLDFRPFAKVVILKPHVVELRFKFIPDGCYVRKTD